MRRTIPILAVFVSIHLFLLMTAASGTIFYEEDLTGTYNSSMWNFGATGYQNASGLCILGNGADWNGLWTAQDSRRCPTSSEYNCNITVYYQASATSDFQIEIGIHNNDSATATRRFIQSQGGTNGSYYLLSYNSGLQWRVDDYGGDTGGTIKPESKNWSGYITFMYNMTGAWIVAFNNGTRLNNISWQGGNDIILRPQFGMASYSQRGCLKNISVNNGSEAPATPSYIVPYTLNPKTWNNMTSIFQFQNWYPACSNIIAGVNSSDSLCNATMGNVSYTKYSGTANLTMATDGQSYSLIAEESTTNVLYDDILFRVCSVTASKPDAQIRINSTLHSTIPSSTIPLCSVGWHEERNTTQAYIANRSLNVSVQCSGCSASKQLMLVYGDNETGILNYKRSFSSHTETLVYNTTNKFYVYSGNEYEYFRSFQNISYRCNGTSLDMFRVINTKILSGAFLSVNDVAFANGTTYNLNISNIIIAELTGEGINSINFNITYANGTLIRNVSSETLNVSNTEINLAGVYNITITAKNINSTSVGAIGWLIFNDTTKPRITWISPDKGNGSLFNANKTNDVNVTFYDENLYGFMLVMRRPDGTNNYNNTLTGLSSPEYKLSFKFTPDTEGFYLAKAWVWDAHTANSIPEMSAKAGYDSIGFLPKISMGNGEVQYYPVNISWDYGVRQEKPPVITKGFDRYYFAYKLDALDMKAWEKPMIRVVVRCDGIDPVRSKYTAHFVCFDSRSWIDFQNDHVTEWERKRVSNDSYMVTLYLDGKESLINFSSFGIINEQYEEVQFYVQSSAVGNEYNSTLIPYGWFNTDGLNVNTTSGVLTYFLIIFIIIAFIVFTELVKIPILGILTSVIIVFCGWVIAATLSMFLGVMIIFIAAVYFMRSLYFMN